MNPALHYLPAAVCALAFAGMCILTREAWRDWARPNPAASDLGWMAATPIVTVLAGAGFAVSLLGAITGAAS